MDGRKEKGSEHHPWGSAVVCRVGIWGLVVNAVGAQWGSWALSYISSPALSSDEATFLVQTFSSYKSNTHTHTRIPPEPSLIPLLLFFLLLSPQSITPPPFLFILFFIYFFTYFFMPALCLVFFFFFFFFFKVCERARKGGGGGY